MTATLRDCRQGVLRYIEGLGGAGGDWLGDRRQAALQRFDEIGFPHAKLEAWRYTGVEGLLQQEFETSDRTPTYSREAAERKFLSDKLSARLVFVDGVYQPGLSHGSSSGIACGGLRAAVAAGARPLLEAVGSLSGAGEHGFAALNLATLHDGAVIRVPRNLRLEQPIELLHLATPGALGRALRSRHLVVLEEGAHASLIERYLALDGEGAYFNNLVSEIFLGEGAVLHHQRVQTEAARAYHLNDIYLGLQARADYRGVFAGLGAAWSRTSVHTRFASRDASFELDGIYLAGDGQLSDFHLDVDHAVPRCRSRENFKGIVHGAGKAVFDGMIRVQKQAQKSDARLHNANLLLSRRGEVDSKPQLVILADDVQCGHGSSVGQLDPQAIFYLRSRGLDEGRARQLLCLGFAEEILERFESIPLRRQLTEVIRRQLGQGGGG